MGKQSPRANAQLIAGYEAALLTLNAATTALILHLAANTRPTAAEMAAEASARAAVEEARTRLWPLASSRASH